MKWNNLDISKDAFQIIVSGTLLDMGFLSLAYRGYFDAYGGLLHCWIFDAWLNNILVGELIKCTDSRKIFPIE